MKVAVVGGTGTLGKPLVAALAQRDHEVLALSRKAPRELPAGTAHRRIDLTDGSGLAAALEGIEVVVDCSNSNPRNAAPVLVKGTKRLLPAGAAAGVRHHIGISIVGCDLVPLAYYDVKVEQEEAIAGGGLPWSLVRATQFHPLIGRIFAAAARLGVAPTGRARLQPVDPGMVAERLVTIVEGEPAGRLGDVAGPEVLTLSELARIWRRAGHRALPLRIPMLGRAGRALREGALCAPDAAAGGSTFEEWLARR